MPVERRTRLSLCTLLLLGICFMPLAAHAATITVNTTATGINNDAPCSLTEAISATQPSHQKAQCGVHITRNSLGLLVSKNADRSTAAVGDVIHYTYIITNTSNVPITITFADWANNPLQKTLRVTVTTSNNQTLTRDAPITIPLHQGVIDLPFVGNN